MTIEQVEYTAYLPGTSIEENWFTMLFPDLRFWSVSDHYVKMTIDRIHEVVEAGFPVKDLREYVISSNKTTFEEFPTFMVTLCASNLVNNLYLEFLINKWQ